MSVVFTDHDAISKLSQKRRLAAFLQNLLLEHRVGIRKVKLNYIFCSDAYLLQINHDYLNHDTLTDIITFDLSETGLEVTGEIYISVERVAENAVIFGVSYLEELHRVVFHGALHLCGYKDKTSEEKKEMRSKEEHCLTAYFESA